VAYNEEYGESTSDEQAGEDHRDRGRAGIAEPCYVDDHRSRRHSQLTELSSQSVHPGRGDDDGRIGRWYREVDQEIGTLWTGRRSARRRHLGGPRHLRDRARPCSQALTAFRGALAAPGTGTIGRGGELVRIKIAPASTACRY